MSKITAEAKTCTKCGVEKPLTEFHRRKDRPDGRSARCRSCISERDKLYYPTSPRATNPQPSSDRKAPYRAANRDRINEYFADYSAGLRAAVFDHYGRSCACCGTTENLSIDHVNGDGGQHRTELFGSTRGGGSTQMYLWLVKNGFPGGFQVLCQPCNASKQRGECCRLDHEARDGADTKADEDRGFSASGRRRPTGQALENVRLGQQRRRERERAEREAREATGAA